nr:hypothetical protein [Brucella anthropi]
MPANIQQPALTGEDDLVAALSESVSEAVNPRPNWSEADARFLRALDPDALKMKVGSTAKSPTVVGIDWGLEETADGEAVQPTPKQLLAQEIKSAQAAVDAVYAKRAGFTGEYQRRLLEMRSLRERLAKMEEAQKATVAQIRMCDKAAKAHRHTVFALQESGR